MKKATYSTLLVMAMAAAFLAGSIVNQRGGVGAAALTAPGVIRYVCPMHPAVTADREGDCPACGMRLVADLPPPPERGGGPLRSTRPGGVLAVAGQRQLIGVQVGVVETAAAAHTLRMVGRVATDDTRTSTINAGIDGFVREVSDATTGSMVKRNQVLATFSSPDAIPAIQSYIVTLDTMDRLSQSASPTSVQTNSVSSNVQQRVDKVLDLGMSEAQLEEVHQTRLVPKVIRIVAPIDGFVVARGISAGLRFQRGSDFYKIADLGRVWVFADVIGADADHVRPGMRATVTAPDRQRSFEARVSDVPPQFDPVTRTLKVRLELDNPGFILKPDMFVDVELRVTLPPAISVPSGAVVDTGLHRTVFVERGEGQFEPREVQTGWRHEDRVEIVQGLAPGERIVTSGTFFVDSESRMRLARTAGGPAKGDGR
jgi:Cu(I)/Ag(I) efflux system membrane fusion protein